LEDGDSDLFKERAGLFWGPIRGKIRKMLINLQKSSSHEPLVGRHWYLAWDKKIQICSNKLPGVINGHALRGHSFM